MAPPAATSPRWWLITPAESEDAQRRVAGALHGRGLMAGDRVAFVLPTSPDLLAAVLGALRIGIIPVLLNATLLPNEIAELIDDASPSMVIRDEASLHSLLDGDQAELAPVPLGRPMHYTSGTSGRPKGVASGVMSESDAMALFDDEAALWDPQPADVHLMASPIYHSVAVRLAAVHLLRGASVVLLERFEADTWRTAAASSDATGGFMVPAHLQRIFASGGPGPLPRFRRLIHAGSSMPPAVKEQAFAAFGDDAVWEFYGSTEGQFTVCSPDEWRQRPGTVGRARPGRALRVDDDGQIWCRTPSFARFEYWRDREKTDAAWRGDEFTVGDLGRLDDDGYLFLDGRRDDLIISGGVNVYPAEVEAVLARSPGVDEVAVFGRPDDRWGQRVCAAVIGSATVESLSRAAAEALAPYKRPKEIHVVADLPRTATGKVRRMDIAAHLGLER
ncbi:MAG: class I adenylate-forming enzyme family protein [Acidimicrobiales bacterium]